MWLKSEIPPKWEGNAFINTSSTSVPAKAMLCAGFSPAIRQCPKSRQGTSAPVDGTQTHAGALCFCARAGQETYQGGGVGIHLCLHQAAVYQPGWRGFCYGMLHIRHTASGGRLGFGPSKANFLGNTVGDW